jgi:hypothetical protein
MSLSVMFRRDAGGMEALIAILALVIPWVILDLFANRHGFDSRDTLPDDHRR